MDINQVKQLIELLEASQISEIELRDGETTIRVSRQAAGMRPVFLPSGSSNEGEMFTGSALPLASEIPASPDASSQPLTPPLSPTTDYTVTSPMVGTFYRSTSPSDPPLADLNHTIKEGDPLCIIEAMKMMNQITAEKGGILKSILVENGQPVEFGQPLFTLTLHDSSRSFNSPC